MIRLAASAAISLIANAVALVVADLVLGRMSVSAGGFVLAVGLFTLTGVLIEPLLRQIALKNAPALLGSSSLVATLVSLIVTSLFGSSLVISGTRTWVLATVLVWVLSLALRLLLPLVIFKKALGRLADDGPGQRS